jgi:hypothetical protein
MRHSQKKNRSSGCEDRNDVGDIGANRFRSSLPISENPDYHPEQNEPFSQEVHLEIALFRRGL